MLVKNSSRVIRSVISRRSIVTKAIPSIGLARTVPTRAPVLSKLGILNQHNVPFVTVQRMHNSIAASTDGKTIPEEILDMPIEVYHEISDEFMDSLLDQLEILCDYHPEVVQDVEMSQGVMSIEVPSVGTYVINKQPPNKQIWLASPVSGPNRFDYYQKEWVSLRDGTKLLDILNKELSDRLEGDEIDLHY